MSKYKKPSLTVDILIQIGEGIVLIKRKNGPFKGKWAIPGGFVEYGEMVENAAKREAKEETGLEVQLIGLFGVYSDPNRDPRGHTISICYSAKKTGGELKASTDAADVKVFNEIPRNKLAFDHEKILRDFENKVL